MSVAYGPYWDLRGNSSEEKPLDVPQGSEFTEINTGNVYMFDAGTETWYKKTTETGGGTSSGGGVSSPDITMIRVLDRSEYEALSTKDAATLYLIRG